MEKIDLQPVYRLKMVLHLIACPHPPVPCEKPPTDFQDAGSPVRENAIGERNSFPFALTFAFFALAFTAASF